MHAVTVITLGSRNVAKSKQFYTGLGYALIYDKNDLLFFDVGGLHLAVCSLEAIASEVGVSMVSPIESLAKERLLSHALSMNVDSSSKVSVMLDIAVKLGGELVRTATPSSWGGERGYFADPDGHIWEIVYNPKWPQTKAGKLEIPS